MNPTNALEVLPDELTVVRLPPDAPIPAFALTGAFVSVTRSREELSIVCAARDAAGIDPQVAGWRAIRIVGQLDLSLVGVLAGVLTPLRMAGISILAIGTFDTDYVLVRSTLLPRALHALADAGYHIEDAYSS